jgi:hypothetical protein
MDVEEFKRDVAVAYNEALGIALEMPFYVETIPEVYIRKAVSEAKILEAMIHGEGITVPTEAKPEDEKKEPEKEPEKEEVGIGGLFG